MAFFKVLKKGSSLFLAGSKCGCFQPIAEIHLFNRFVVKPKIVMKDFNPIEDVEDSQLILDKNEWPNFHDAEIHKLSIWRGDVRPDEDIWIGPVIEITLELCALRNPYMVVLKFHDCESIKFEDFNHQNGIHDLSFKFEERGILTTGEPLTPYISVNFEQAFGASLSFKCFRVQAINGNEEH